MMWCSSSLASGATWCILSGECFRYFDMCYAGRLEAMEFRFCNSAFGRMPQRRLEVMCLRNRSMNISLSYVWQIVFSKISPQIHFWMKSIIPHRSYNFPPPQLSGFLCHVVALSITQRGCRPRNIMQCSWSSYTLAGRKLCVSARQRETWNTVVAANVDDDDG